MFYQYFILIFIYNYISVFPINCIYVILYLIVDNKHSYFQWKGLQTEFSITKGWSDESKQACHGSKFLSQRDGEADGIQCYSTNTSSKSES